MLNPRTAISLTVTVSVVIGAIFAYGDRLAFQVELLGPLLGTAVVAGFVSCFFRAIAPTRR